MTSSRKPLDDIHIIELSTYVAAPICGRMLADLGAHVIKIETLKGDPWRAATAAFRGNFSAEENPIIDLCNSGKKNIALDLKQPEGMTVLLTLLSNADVFLTNTRSKSLKKLGLDYETLHEQYPQLVYAHISGYGYEGPDAESPGFDNAAFWARSGFLNDMAIQTENTYPITSPTGTGDTVCATTLASSIMAALLLRGKTGLGDFVPVSLYNTALWVMASSVVRSYDRYGSFFPMERGNCSPFSTFYRCSDNEWLMITILDFNRYVPQLMNVIGSPDLLNDPRFSTADARWENCGALISILESAFKKKPINEWLAILQANDIVCSRLSHFRDNATDEQAWSNNYVETLVSPNGQQCVIPRSPIRLGSQEIAHTSPASNTGADTAEVLRDIGYSEDAIAGLYTSHVAR